MVGDKVTPLTQFDLFNLGYLRSPRDTNDINNIRECLTHCMYTEFGGSRATIRNTRENYDWYNIKEDGCRYSWSSLMFRESYSYCKFVNKFNTLGGVDMQKTIRLADNQKLDITIHDLDTTQIALNYFKYEVISVIDGNVNFRFITSPRAISNTGVGIMRITHNNTVYYVGSSVCPEADTNLNCIFTHGTDTDADNTILTLPVDRFNILQAACLIWNCNKIGHKFKQVYVICPQCSHSSISKKNLQDLPNFSLYGDTCCPLPEYIYIKTTLKDFYDSTNIYKFSAPFTKHTATLNREMTLYDYVNFLRDTFRYSTETYLDLPIFQAIRIQNLCGHCGTPNTDIPWLTLNDLLRVRNFDACSVCRANLEVCCICGYIGTNLTPWGEYKVCSSCLGSNTCYVCSADNTQDTTYVPVVSVSMQNHTYRLCCDHYNIVRQNDFTLDSIQMKPELNYSFKLNAAELKVHTVEEHKPLLDVVSVIPFAAVEWEFPFNADACKTNLRDRAIWQFNNIQKECGHPDLFIAKHDGSLPNFATEFVSHAPTTLDMWHKLYFNGILGKLARLIDINYVNSSRNSIGGHIHINRGSFSPVQIAKYLKFLYSNLDFMSFICDRDQVNSSHYYANKTSINPLCFAYNDTSYSPEKYTLARVTSNVFDKKEVGTIEVRAFKSPTSDVQLMQNVEFMFALRDFVITISGNDSIKSDAFMDFVTKEKYKLYPLLSEKIIGRDKTNFSINIPNVPRVPTGVRPKRKIYSISDIKCSHCTTQISPEEAVNMEGRYYCNACIISCYNCGTEYISNDGATQVDGSNICPICYETRTYTCTNCGVREYNRSSFSIHNHSDMRVCGECVEEIAVYYDCCDSNVLRSEDTGTCPNECCDENDDCDDNW